MSDTNQVTLSLTNRLFVKDKDGNVNEVMSWEVAQSRYFDPTFGGAVIPGQRNVIESTEELDGFDFLDGPRNYSPIVSVLRFQHVVGFEWRMDYDPLLGRISNSSFNGNIRLSKYFFSLGHTEVNPNPVVTAPNNQINVLMAVGNQNRKGWNAAVNAFYDVRRDILDFATTEITYNTDCCGISVEYRRYNFGDARRHAIPALIFNRQCRLIRKSAQTGTDLLIRHRFAAHGFIQQYGELSRLVIDIVLEIRQAALHRLQFVGQMQTGQNSGAGGVDVAGSHGDGGHQIIHSFAPDVRSGPAPRKPPRNRSD